VLQAGLEPIDPAEIEEGASASDADDEDEDVDVGCRDSNNDDDNNKDVYANALND
jgi:hypothetical protein